MSPDTIAALSGSAVVLVGGLVAAVRWVRPRIKSGQKTLNAVTETLLGREAIVDDATGKELVPAQVGLGLRLARLEDGFAQLAAQSARMDTIERIQMQQGEQVQLNATEIAALKAATMERIATKAESAQMWRAVADGDDPDLAPPVPPID